MYGTFLDLKSYNPWLRIQLPLNFFIHVFLPSFYSYPVTGYMDKTRICKKWPQLHIPLHSLLAYDAEQAMLTG